jgi:FtsZ-interacting cell division protein ZipA
VPYSFSAKVTLPANNTYVTVYTKTVTGIEHNPDGTKSIPISVTGGISGTTYTSTALSGNAVLDTILRASSLSIPQSINTGTNLITTITPVNTTFRHKVQYIIDGVAIQQTITSQETTSYSVEVSKSNASLTVVGEEGQPIKGIKVQFKDTSGNIVFEGETNDNGKILITGVAAGSYSYIINNLPSPYINKTYSQTFSINQKGEVEGLDSCVLEHTKVLVTLKDKLEGAVFQLVNKADNSKTYTATTNEEGVATFVKVEDGEYTLTQVEAPEGYTLSTQEETIVLNRDSKATLSFNFENKTASTEDEIIPGEPEDPEEPVEKKGNKIIIIAVCIILLVLGATVYAVIKTKKDDDQEHDNDDSDNDNNVNVAPVVPTTPAPAKEEKPKKVKEVKTPKIQKAPKVKEVKVEPPVATPVVPEEKPVRPAGPAFYMEDEDEDEFMPDIELSRPAVDDFNFDPYEQEELEKVQEEIQETVQSVLEENTSEIDLDITKEEAPTMELPEIELPVEEAPVVEAPATEVVDEDDDDDDGYDLSYLFAEMMQNSSEETGEDLQDETTPANQGKDTSDNN